MVRDLIKLALTTVVLVVLLLIGVGAGVLISGWLRDRPTVITGEAVLEGIDHVNKQVFIEHVLAVPVSHQDAPKGILEVLAKWGIKQEFVVLVHGRVPCGFDLQGLGVQNVWISGDGTRVQLILPPPVVFEENISIDKTDVLSRTDWCPDFICEDELDVFANEVQQEAKEILLEHALRNGILEQTAQDGKDYFEGFLKALGFKEVNVIVTGYGF